MGELEKSQSLKPLPEFVSGLLKGTGRRGEGLMVSFLTKQVVARQVFLRMDLELIRGLS